MIHRIQLTEPLGEVHYHAAAHIAPGHARGRSPRNQMPTLSGGVSYESFNVLQIVGHGDGPGCHGNGAGGPGDGMEVRRVLGQPTAEAGHADGHVELPVGGGVERRARESPQAHAPQTPVSSRR